MQIKTEKKGSTKKTTSLVTKRMYFYLCVTSFFVYNLTKVKKEKEKANISIANFANGS